MFLRQGSRMYPPPRYRNRNLFFPQGITPYHLPNRSIPTSKANTFITLADKGMTGLSKTLSNVQQVLNVVQTTAPIIQEYGPMVKNLPAMYRMMKAFKEIQQMDGEEGAEQKETKAPETREAEKRNQPSREKNGISTPKLFI